MISQIIWSFMILYLVQSNDSDFVRFLASTPNTFGLLTVTHARNGDYSYFRRHLDTYASMQCSQISQVSVVWNNDIQPDQAGFIKDSKWKRPVYFRKTPYNSMDFRYLLPEQSKAAVFFSIDDDVFISCEEMVRTFQIWRQKAIGDIAPLMSYGPRGFDYRSKAGDFTYTDPIRARLYSISLIGICWVPRFYFQLYNSQKLWQMKAMREIVQEKNNCDDIALNFLVSHLFPQFLPISLTGPMRMKIQPSSQGLLRTHYPNRNECLRKFTDIIGYNPLKIVNREGKSFEKRTLSKNEKYIIYLKRRQFDFRFVSEIEGTFQTKDLEQQQQIINQQIQQQSQANNRVKDSFTQRKQQLTDLIKATKTQHEELLIKLEVMLQKNDQPIENQNTQTSKSQQKDQKPELNESNKENFEKSDQVSKVLQFVTIISFIGTLFVFGMLVYFCRVCYLDDKNITISASGNSTQHSLDMSIRGKKIGKLQKQYEEGEQ